MTLSAHEREVLDKIADRIAAEDPDFAGSLAAGAVPPEDGATGRGRPRGLWRRLRGQGE